MHHYISCTGQVSIEAAAALPSGKGGAGAPNRDQHMRFMYNYLSKKDNSVLDDPRSTPAQRDVTITSRLTRLGVRRPSELGLVKWILTLLVEAEQKLYGRWPTYKETYDRVQTIKGLMHTQTPYGGPTILHYPESPGDMDERVFRLAYDQDDPPCMRYVPRYEMIGNHVPLRWDNKMLQAELSSNGETLVQRYGRSQTMPAPREHNLLQDLRDHLDREEIGFRFTQPREHSDHRGVASSWGGSWGGNHHDGQRHLPNDLPAIGWYEQDHQQNRAGPYGGSPSWKPRWGEEVYVYMEAMYQAFIDFASLESSLCEHAFPKQLKTLYSSLHI